MFSLLSVFQFLTTNFLYQSAISYKNSNSSLNYTTYKLQSYKKPSSSEHKRHLSFTITQQSDRTRLTSTVMNSWLWYTNKLNYADTSAHIKYLPSIQDTTAEIQAIKVYTRRTPQLMITNTYIFLQNSLTVHQHFSSQLYDIAAQPNIKIGSDLNCKTPTWYIKSPSTDRAGNPKSNTKPFHQK